MESGQDVIAFWLRSHADENGKYINVTLVTECGTYCFTAIETHPGM